MTSRTTSVSTYVATVFAIGCATQGQTKCFYPYEASYMVPGSAIVDAYGLRESLDTLPEMDPSQVPAAVRQQALQMAVAVGDPGDCNRFFLADDRYVVVPATACGTSLDTRLDGGTTFGVMDDGSPLGQAPYYDSGDEIVPTWRFDWDAIIQEARLANPEVDGSELCAQFLAVANDGSAPLR